MSTVEERLVQQSLVEPNWLPDGESFWYRRQPTIHLTEFILVDAPRRSRQLAFDHSALAQALEQRTGTKVNGENLPISWIEITPDHARVRFQYGDSKWEFQSNGTLEQWDGNFERPDPRFLEEEVPSSGGSNKVTVTFMNQSGSELSVYWIDFSGNPVHYMSIGSNDTANLETFSGHVWRISEGPESQTRAIYRAPRAARDTVVIGHNRISLEGSIGPSVSAAPALPQDTEIEKEQQKFVNKEDCVLPIGDTSPNADPENPESRAINSLRSEEDREIIVEDHNLYLKVGEGRKTQLSFNGNADNTFDPSTIHLTSDKQYAIAWQYIPEQEHTLTLIESSPKDQLQPKVKSLQYLKPGDRRRIDRPRLYDLNNATEVPTDDTLFSNPYNLENVGWSRDEQEYRFIINERGHQRLSLLSIDRNGSVKVLIEDRSETFINYSQKSWWKLLQETDEMIWASERHGWNHLYVFDLSKGQEPRRLTQGTWNVYKVEQVDETQRRLFLQAYGVLEGDPYHAYLVRVDLDGSDFTVLTNNSDGTHTWAWSPTKRYLLDTWSRVDLPPHVSLRDAESGEELAFLEKGDLDTVEGGSTWNAPERFVALGRDGTTEIYGIIIRPYDFDENKSYPVIEDIYAGPHDFFTPKGFSTLSQQREWADLGFIIVQIDGMGTNWRSKAFHDVCYKNLKDAGLPDRMAWMRAAASTRPWMDLSRVGIFGTSAGGQSAAAALLHHGDFYKVAAADSGCHDNRMDKMWWNEQWMGYPIDESYVASSNATHASKLTGKLMLIVGELDDNVDPSSTLQLVDALNRADKDYELLYVPGGGHGCGASGYPLRRQKAFFKRHLLGSEA